MKSKASLFLMEQLMMVLIFALCAALCLGVFVRASEISEEITRRDEAVIIAQNAAEVLKACADPSIAAELAGSGGYVLQIREEASGITGLRQAKIVVSYEDSEVFSLTVGFRGVGE